MVAIIVFMHAYCMYRNIILEWTTSFDTSSRTLFVREDVHITSNVELRNYVPLFGVTQSNVDLRNYVISHQIVI